MSKLRVATIVGTRPEAIKLAPVIGALAREDDFESIVISTAQHRQLLDQVLELFEIRPDHDLNLMRDNQTLAGLASRSLEELSRLLGEISPQLIVVQGDTTTAMMGALAGFYNRAAVAHVEAGLRSFDKYSPFPEEMNRKVVTQIADLHFAPTNQNLQNLLREGVPGDAIVVTGNPVIDALLHVASLVDRSDLGSVIPGLNGKGRLMLVTAHRRESFGTPFEGICAAIRRIVETHPDLTAVYPVHPNPNVQTVVNARLGDHDRIRLIDPLDYKRFVTVMKYADLVLTDSGGVQEEAPSLGKPILVLRDVTERGEAVDAGTVRLVGRDPNVIFDAAHELLSDSGAYAEMARSVNPYGDGHASARIVKAIRAFMGRSLAAHADAVVTRT